ICGEFSKNIMENLDDSIFDKFPKSFKRFQINYNFKKGTPKSSNEIANMFEGRNMRDGNYYILQHNKSNAHFLGGWFPKNVHALYDSSGGRGTMISEIEDPLSNFSYTGYSGGISPENIIEIKNLIQGVHHSNLSEVWIDMESGIMDENNRLSIKKCIKILEKFQ
ncbi:MAG: hypothetical protein ACRCU6_09400, partial [Fusobacteriaceae bacterium]